MSLSSFASSWYQEHNRARLTHLASLGLALDGKRVLEVGSGPGDHTGFYIERGCTITAVDARRECLDALKARFPTVAVRQADMNEPHLFLSTDVVHCYGLLYHLQHPEVAIRSMASACRELLLLETCVSLGDSLKINPIFENDDFTQASSRIGCRPTRRWVFEELKKHFLFVYQTVTQPNHPEFPLNWHWAAITPGHGLIRVVLVASRSVLDSSLLSPVLLDRQVAQL
jgi:SAM-dependent methyltransferase